MMTERFVTLHGRIFLRADIELLTGLHIGGAAAGLEIGGLDKPVIRNPRTNEPYIPGSSLKGKLRSLMEKAHGAPQTFRVNEGVFVHAPESIAQYRQYQMIGGVFGVLPRWGPNGNRNAFTVPAPTRLAVRDVPLRAESREELKRLRTDLPFTEIKWEAAIDRVTSAAAPRQIERVPAGAVFGPAELVYSVYVGKEETPTGIAALFDTVIEALLHLEDDYLGGMGSRGNGQVRLKNLHISARRVRNGQYGDEMQFDSQPASLKELDRAALKTWLEKTFA
jgi:CRISPR-associated protein Csm3